LFATIDGTLWTVRRDGSNPQRLTMTHLDLIEAAWSPDGRQIAFIDCRTPGSSACAHAPAWDVYVLRIGSRGKRRRVTRRDIALGNLSWAPARRIAFEGDQGVYVANPAAASERVAIPRARGPSWSPDGRWLAANLSGGPVVARPDGSGRHFLGKFRGASIAVPPAWSTDSRRVAFARPGKIFSARVSGGGVKRVL
jgi:Tol biopolymer transport system component